jgi:hypothetical protein
MFDRSFSRSLLAREAKESRIKPRKIVVATCRHRGTATDATLMASLFPSRGKSVFLVVRYRSASKVEFIFVFMNHFGNIVSEPLDLRFGIRLAKAEVGQKLQ